MASRGAVRKPFPILSVNRTKKIHNGKVVTAINGFDTALNIATEALDRLHTTAESHHRAMVLELMGRDAGFIALQAGVSGGADVILIPEIPFNFESIMLKSMKEPQRDVNSASSQYPREQSPLAVPRPFRAKGMRFMCRA